MPDRPGSIARRPKYGYDSFGNRISTTVEFDEGGVAKSRLVTTSYEATGRFPQIVTNAVNHSEVRVYDLRFGTLQSSTDANGVRTEHHYDGFGRKSATSVFDGLARMAMRTTWTRAAVTSAGPEKLYVRQRASGGAESITYFDMLERPVRTDVKAFDGSIATSTIGYDDRGRKAEMWRPVAADGYTGSRRTRIGYDNLDRPVEERIFDDGGNPYAITSSGYGVAIEVDTNAGGNVARATLSTTRTVGGIARTARQFRNSQGQVVKLEDAAGKTSVLGYDASGNMISFTPPGASAPTATFEFDRRGHRTRMSDANMGVWTFGYNGAGDLIRQVDARGLATVIVPDALGRPRVRKEYYGAEEAADAREARWTYDDCAYGKGSLCSVTSGHRYLSTKVYQEHHGRDIAFDTVGRPVRTAWRLFGDERVTFSFADANGRPRFVSYPQTFGNDNAYGVYTEYNAAGYPYRVMDNAASPHLMWQAVSRYGDGQIREQVLSNAQVTHGYDVLGRVSRITGRQVWNGSGPLVQSSAFAWDEAGNLVSRAENSLGQSWAECFEYDPLDRLVRVRKSAALPCASAAITKTYGYGDQGNLETKSDIGALVYGDASRPGGAGPHAVRSAAGLLWEYDANGNAVCARVGTGDCAKRFDYGVHNVPARVTSGGVATDFVQDERGQRFYRLARQGGILGPVLSQTFHVGDTFFEEEWVEGVAAWRHYVHTPEGVVAIAKRHSSGPAWDWRFWHRDHLGSPVRETWWDGSGAEAASWDAWGKRRLADAADGTPGNLVALTGARGFTGHEHLDGHGLVHMNGRMYEPSLGRFVNADPLVQAPLDARSWNRYSYVMNNPLAYTDPTGYSWWTKWRRPILAIAAAWALGPGGFFGEGGIFGSGGLGWASGTTAGYTSAAASGFAAGGIQGGNLQSAVQGAFFGTLFFGVGEFSGAHAAAGAGRDMTLGERAFQVAGHAAAGCGQSAAAGGSCREGATSAGFAALAGPMVDGDALGQFAARAAVGGIASRLGGGKFENGAYTAAFAYLFNECAHTRMCGSDHTRVEVTGNRVIGSSAHTEIQISSGYEFTVIEGQPNYASGKLEGRSNGANSGDAFRIRLDPPVGETASSFASRLRASASRYGNDLWYAPPAAGSWGHSLMDYGYNSNSFVSGVLRDSYGYVLPQIPAAAQRGGFQVPGWYKPIPIPR